MSSIQSGVGSGAALQNESYLFDRVGNVIQRQNGNAGLTENFYYDNLYRLDYSTLGTVGPVTNLDLAYDAMGNITSRSDVAGGAAWTYHATKKHAVVQAGNSSFTYSYDANGNAQARNGYTIDWTSYNYPSVIRGPNKTMTFSYGTDRQRFKQIYQNGSTTETTMYVGQLLEKVTIGSVVDWRHYVTVGGQIVAVVSRKNDGVTTTNTTRYLLEDHQGSVSQIVANSGPTFEYVSESFTAFGARRAASTWSGPCPCPDLAKIKDTTRRGYTGHEAIGGVSMGLNHMNGRVQDAITGRFLSPDAFVQAPSSTQSFNRYAYAFNNPLSHTDPSGFTHEVISTCDICWGQGIASLGAWWSSFDSGSVGADGGGGGGGDATSEEVIVAATPPQSPKEDDKSNCGLLSDLKNLRESFRRWVYSDAPIPYIALTATGVAGAGDSAAFRQWGAGLNLAGQAFAQDTVPAGNTGMIDAAFALIVAGEAGFNVGFSRGIQTTGVSEAHLTQGFAYARGGASFGVESSSSGANASVPDMAVPRGLRLGTGFGLGGALLDGKIKTFSNATDPAFVDPPSGYTSCEQRR